jgi:glycosyltransferase involved in cell wall biosynthesis
MRLSVFSIVKNEEAMIEGMLQSAREADEHIVCDTGSTDRTRELVQLYTPFIYTDYTWNDDFAEAKNHAMQKCTGDWVIGLDADCRFEEGFVGKVKNFLETFEGDVATVRLVWNDIANRDKSYHRLPKLFRRESGVQYIGRVHETITKAATGDVDAAIVYLYSPTHKSDPDRNIRILLKDDLTKPRTLFYLGREHYERRRYAEAIAWLEKYLQSDTWYSERAEAYLTLARCYWFTQEGNKAREACLRAISLNPDFKEALLFMSGMCYEPWKSKWKKMADIADNSNVMFVRV